MRSRTGLSIKELSFIDLIAAPEAGLRSDIYGEDRRRNPV